MLRNLASSRQAFSLNLGLSDSVRLTEHWAPGVLLSLPPQDQCRRHVCHSRLFLSRCFQAQASLLHGKSSAIENSPQPSLVLSSEAGVWLSGKGLALAVKDVLGCHMYQEQSINSSSRRTHLQSLASLPLPDSPCSLSLLVPNSSSGLILS